MANRNSKAKGTTMVDVKLKKANEKITVLAQQLAQSNMGLLNMRQMYEGATQEKMALQQRLASIERMLVALVIQSRGKKATIKEATLAKLSNFAGINTSAEGEDLLLTAVSVEQMEEMQADGEDDEQE